MSEQLQVSGASIALLSYEGYPHPIEVLAIQRDDKPEIAYPNMWEFPGGTLDPGETPLDCALRELWEETGVVLPRELVVWEAFYPRRNTTRSGKRLYNAFFAAYVSRHELSEIHKGDEGRDCRWMKSIEFQGFGSPSNDTYFQAIPDHISRLDDFYHRITGHTISTIGGLSIEQVA